MSTQTEQELMILLLRLLEKNGFSETSSAFKKEYQKSIENGISESGSNLESDVDWRGKRISRSAYRLLNNYNHIPHSRILELLPYCDHGLLKVPSRALKLEPINCLAPLPTRDFRPVLMFSGEDRVNKLCSIQGHLVPVFCTIFDGTGTLLFSGGDDNLVKVWDVKTGLLLRTIRAHKTVVGNDPGVIVDLAINPQNTLLATSSSDKTIRIWDLKTFEPLDRIVLSKPITAIEFSKAVPISSPLLLLVTANDSKVRIYHEDPEKKGVFQKEPLLSNSGTLLRDQVSMISIDSTGLIMAAAGGDGIVYMFSLFDYIGKCVQTFESHEAPVTDVSFSSSGLRMVSGCKVGCLAFYELSTINGCWTIKYRVNIALEKDSTLHGPVSNNSNVEQIPPSAGNDSLNQMDSSMSKTKACTVEIVSVVFNCSESVVISSSTDFIIRVWNFEHGSCLRMLTGHKSGVVILETHPFIETVLLSGCLEGNVFLWNVMSGEMLYSYQFMDPILSGLFSPCGEIFSISDAKGSVHLFGAASDEELYQYSLPEQFFLNDWNAVTENSLGQLLDTQSHQLAHLMPTSAITCRNRIPHHINMAWALLQSRDFHPTNRITIANDANREILWISQFSTFLRVLGSSAAVDITKKKDLLKRRRQVIKSDALGYVSNNPIIYDQTDFLSIPLALPDSSGDEYSGESGHSDVVSDELEDDVAVTPDNLENTIGVDELGQNALSERTERRRKRTRASGIISDSESSDKVDVYSVQEHSGRKRVKRTDRKPGFFRIEDSDDDDSILVHQKDDQTTISNVDEAAHSKKSLDRKVEPPTWLISSNPNTLQYIPQIGDVVAYIKTGHLEFLNSVAGTSSVQFESAEELSFLPDRFVGKVLSLEYFTAGLDVGCKVTLSIDDAVKNIDEISLVDWKSCKKTTLMLCDYNCRDFLVLAHLYFDSLKKLYDVGDNLIGHFSDGEHRLVVKEVSSSTWSKYSVSFIDDEGSEVEESFQMSPWEFRRLEDEPCRAPRLEERDVQRLDSVIEGSLENSDGNLDLFREPVPYNQYPTYLLLVAYPLYISLIQNRLRSGYYRQVEHFYWEWNQMCKNVFLYNDPSALVYKLAKKYLCPILSSLTGESIDGKSSATMAQTSKSDKEDIKLDTPFNNETDYPDEKEVVEVVQVSRKPGLRIRISMKQQPVARRSARSRRLRITKLNESSDEYEEDEEYQEVDEDVA